MVSTQAAVAGNGFDFADKGEAELKGFEDPVRLFEVRWRKDPLQNRV